MNLTKKQKVDEFIRCVKNPIHFINNYVKIQHPIDGWVPFDLYPFQEELIKIFQDERLVVVNKARQMGLTTLISGYCLWMINFQKGKKIGFVATKKETAAILVGKIQDAYEDLPNWMKLSKVVNSNVHNFKLSNKSSAKAYSKSRDTGRGLDASLVVLDEAAHIDENMEKFWGGLKATTSEGGSIIVASTPNGAGDWFCNIFEGAREGINGFASVEIPWHLHPKRDKKWFESETKSMSKRMIAQEHLCSFNLSGQTFFEPESIERLQKNIKDPISKQYSDRCLWLWEDAKVEKTYLICADVATGDAGDYSAFHVISTQDLEIVADYKGKIQPDEFANLLYSIGLKYNTAMIAVENNSYGIATTLKLVDLQYPNIYYSKSGEYIEQYLVENGSVSGAKAGFTTSSKNRILILNKLEEHIRKNEIKIYSERFFNECRTFTWKNGRPEAQKGRNDDLIMSLAIGIWVRETAIIQNQRSSVYSAVCLNSIIKTTTKFDTKIPGMQGYNRKMSYYDTGKKEEETKKNKSEYIKYGWII